MTTNLQKTSRFCGIDPSTKTGFVILDEHGRVVYENEFTSKKTDPERMIDILQQLKKHLNAKTDIVVIEGFSFNSKGRRVDFQYGLGWLIRAWLFIENIKYVDVPPKQLKKFACGNGNAKKTDMVTPVETKWGFVGRTDNITDAYVLARIGYSAVMQTKLLNYEKKVIYDVTTKL